jgi:hypothetical protein
MLPAASASAESSSQPPIARVALRFAESPKRSSAGPQNRATRATIAFLVADL